MKIPFPTLPVFDKERWNNDLNLLNKPPFNDLIETYLPFAYFELPDYTGEEVIHRFNELFQDFTFSLHPKNKCPWPDYIRELRREGGLSHLQFPDGFVHPHSKMFYYGSLGDDNSYDGYTGVMIRNHCDQKSLVYGSLRIAEAFAQYLSDHNIRFRLFLRKHDVDENLEVEM